MTPEIVVVRRRINAAFLLGIVVLSRGCANPQAETGVLPMSDWGGDHMLLSIGETVAQVEYDCAHGTVALPILLAEGEFSALGTYTQEHGGPVHEGELVTPKPARYTGRVFGDRMSVTVTLTEEKRVIGSFDLTRGSSGRVFKCL